MSKNLLSALKSYLEKVSGVAPVLQAKDVSHLPFYLRDRHTFFSTDLFGRQWNLMLQTNETDAPASAGEYEKQAKRLASNLEGSPVLVLPSLPSNTRNRLVQKGVPFIVPGKQAFLPAALVDLRERFPRPLDGNRTTLSPTAQTTVLFHLLRESLEGVPLGSIARKLGCSAMMISKVKAELQAAGICTVQQTGKTVFLVFPENKWATWERARDKMQSPVKEAFWGSWNKVEPPGLLAGINALSHYSMLGEDRLPGYALESVKGKALVKQGLIKRLPDPDEANIRIELWAYDPALLSDAATVDPLSLFLSLRATGDERVEQALEHLIKGLPW